MVAELGLDNADNENCGGLWRLGCCDRQTMQVAWHQQAATGILGKGRRRCHSASQWATAPWLRCGELRPIRHGKLSQKPSNWFNSPYSAALPASVLGTH